MHWLENLCFENSKQHLKIHDKYFYAAQVLQKLNFLLVFLILCFAKQRFLLKDAKGKEVFSIREDYYAKELDNNTIVCPFLILWFSRSIIPQNLYIYIDLSIVIL